MKFEKAKKLVGKRLGDLDLQLYRDTVGGFLIEAICDLAILPETRAEDIKGLTVNQSVTISGDLVLSNYPMLKLLNIYSRTLDISAVVTVFFTELSQDMFGLIGVDNQVKPDKGEIFWCKYHTIVQFYKSSFANGKAIYLLYIKEPDDYEDRKELNNIMTIGFQYKVIDLAVKKMRQDLGVPDDVKQDKT